MVVADLDYLSLVGSPDVRALFQPNWQKAWEVLTRDKKSTDASAMITALRQAIVEHHPEELERFWTYFAKRHQRLSTDLTDSDVGRIRADLRRLWEQQTLLLEDGEIEDYLPTGVRDVRAVVEMTADRGWIDRVPAVTRRVRLGEILCEIVDASELERQVLRREIEDGADEVSQGILGPEVRSNECIGYWKAGVFGRRGAGRIGGLGARHGRISNQGRVAARIGVMNGRV